MGFKGFGRIIPIIITTFFLLIAKPQQVQAAACAVPCGFADQWVTGQCTLTGATGGFTDGAECWCPASLVPECYAIIGSACLSSEAGSLSYPCSAAAQINPPSNTCICSSSVWTIGSAPTPTPTPTPTPAATPCGYTGCVDATCGSGTKYYVFDVGGYSTYLADTPGSSAASVVTCTQDSSTVGNYHSLYVVCGPVPPTTGFISCSDNPTLSTYYLHSSYLGLCGSNSSACTAGGPTPTPTPSVTPSPSPACNYNIGGAGRMCTGAVGAQGSCCAGYTCEYAGAQPMKLFPTCADGVSGCITPADFKTGFQNNASPDALMAGVNPGMTDLDIFGATTPPNRATVCVPTSVPKPAIGQLPFRIHYPNTLVVGTNMNLDAVAWDSSNNYLKCYLRDTDPHRYRVSGVNEGCACTAGFEPRVMTQAQADTIVFYPQKSNKLNLLWAQVQGALHLAMQKNKKEIKTVAKVAGKMVNQIIPNAEAACYSYTPPAPTCGTYPPCACDQLVTDPAFAPNMSMSTCLCCSISPPDSCGSTTSTTVIGPGDECCPTAGDALDCADLPGWTPNPAVCTGPFPTPKPITVDRGFTAGVPWQPWNTSNYAYGNRVGGPITAGVMAGSATEVMACAPVCNAPAFPDPTDPSKCACTPPAVYNTATGTCSTCSIEGQYPDPSNPAACICPSGYVVKNLSGVDKCRPITSGEFIDGTSGAEEGYPVCGPGRLPVTYGLSIQNIASSSVPRSAISTTYVPTAFVYPYASPSNAGPTPAPIYLYNGYDHCACAGHTVAGAPPVAGLSVMPSTSGSSSRFYSDAWTEIISRGSDGKPSQRYGMVAASADDAPTGTAVDPRLGTGFVAGTSKCVCPNVNEVPVSNNATDELAGVNCIPAITAADPSMVAFNSNFDPVAHDPIVLNRSNEQVTGSGAVVERINLPTSATNPNTFRIYERGIWTCALGYDLDVSTGTCSYNDASHVCDATSEVSPFVTGANTAARFANSVNKKLNCCGFQFGSVGTTGASPVKFDCISNNNKTFNNFDALWAGSDLDEDGGQLYAVALSDRGGRKLTGWYTLDGRRCDEFSEFSATPIQRGILNPIIVQGQASFAAGGANFEAQGAAIPVPSGTGWTQLIAGYGPARTRIPQPQNQTRDELVNANRCPVLVRAAAVYACDQNAVGSNLRRTIVDGTDSRDSTTKLRCAAAAQTTVHIRVEQVFSIAGQKKLAPVDTVMEGTAVKNITLKDLMRVNGFGSCPTGMTRQGDDCTY